MDIAILTISDRSFSGEREDRSGPALRERVEGRSSTGEGAGWRVAETHIVPDDRDAIEALLRAVADESRADVILTTGGTGLAPRDVTPEATQAVLDRRIPGMAEAMRAASLTVTPNAMISRAEAGVRGECIIVNLPGSPKGAVECFDVVAPALVHAVKLVRGEKADK